MGRSGALDATVARIRTGFVAVVVTQHAELRGVREIREGGMIRRVLFTAIAAVVVMAAPASVGAIESPLDYESAIDALLAVDPTIEPAANDPGKDFVVGGFQHSSRNNKVGFSGQSGPLGESPWGHLSETIPTPGGLQQGRFRVTCVAVAGKSAAIGLEPTDAASNDQPDAFVLALFDGGPGGTLDLFAFLPIPPEQCLFGIGEAVLPIELGNILVHDALP